MADTAEEDLGGSALEFGGLSSAMSSQESTSPLSCAAVVGGVPLSLPPPGVDWLAPPGVDWLRSVFKSVGVWWVGRACCAV